MGFIPGLQGWFNIHKSINVMHYINKRKNKEPYDPVNRCRKIIWQNWASLINKNHRESWIEGTYLNIIKAIYEKPTANIILNGEKLRAFPLRSGTWQGCPLSPLLFNIVLDPSISNQTTKGNQRHQNWQRWSQAFTFARWHHIIHGKPDRLH